MEKKNWFCGIEVIRKLLLFASIIFLLTSCCTKEKSQTVNNAQSDEHWKELKYVEGEVFLPEGMAGCSYLLKLQDEKILQPLNLADSLKQENLKLWIRYHPEKSKMSVCMMGTIVTLDDIQFRK